MAYPHRSQTVAWSQPSRGGAAESARRQLQPRVPVIRKPGSRLMRTVLAISEPHFASIFGRRSYY